MKKISVIVVLFFILIPLPCSSLPLQSFKIGLVMPLSGNTAHLYSALANTAHLAVNEINKTGGIKGTQIELIELDNKNTVLGSRNAGKKAVKAGVEAVIGAIRSSNSMAVAQILQHAGIPMISPTSTNPALTLTGDYIFRVCFVDSFQGKVMAYFAVNDLGAKKAVVLTNTENRYCKGLAENFIRNFKEYGGSVLWEGDYLKNISDFTKLIKQAGQFKPEVIFIPGYVDDAALIIKNARKHGITSIFLGGDAWNDIMYTYGGSAITGSFYSASWHPDSTYSESRDFVKNYKNKFGKIKNYNIGLIYDAFMVLRTAIQKGKSMTSRNIRNSLASIKNFKGVTGTITFNENGDPVDRAAVILEFLNNRSVYFKTVYLKHNHN